ncbi:MAG: glycosyltransferase family 39 protein [Nitrospirae bacterium]|nr:glycosyltransferase family 39 protein [Nitrospirota bacterium]
MAVVARSAAFEPRPLKAVALILSLAAVLRLPLFATPFNNEHAWNEGHYATTALNFDQYGPWTQMNDLGEDHTTTPLYPWIIYASFKLFGVSEAAARLPGFLFGLLSVYLVFSIGRKLQDRRVGLLAALCAAAAPSIIYFSRNVQLESMSGCFGLLAFSLLLSWRQKLANRSLAWATSAQALSILTKQTMVLAFVPFYSLFFKREPKKFAWFMGLSVLPSATWVVLNYLDTGGGTGWYFSRPGEHNLHGIVPALAKGFLWLPEHVGPPIFLFVVIGLMKPLPEKRHLLAYSLIWLALAVPYPIAFMGNRYYDYPGLYGLCLIAGSGLATLRKQNILAVAVAAIVCFGGAKVVLRYRANRFSQMAKSETVPFFSAKEVRRINLDGGRVLVDYPQTAFYAGGDPAYIQCAHGDVRSGVDGSHPYVIANYFGKFYTAEEFDAFMTERGYAKILPLAYSNMR